MRVITHDGTFHTDEVFAIAFLKMFYFKNKKFEIIRTRNGNFLHNVLSDKNSFVIDVGREYNPEKLNFDHHQRAFNTRWSDGTLLSSCGLIWKYLRKNGYLKDYKDSILNRIEKNIIKKIDSHDNGGIKWPLSAIVASCNREPNTIDVFLNAVDTAFKYIENVFYHEENNESNTLIFKRDLENYKDDEIFISSIPAKNSYILNYLSNETNALVVVYMTDEDGEQRWYAKSINKYINISDEDEDEEDILNNQKNEIIQALAPENLRGLSEFALIMETKMEDPIFVHRSGFLAAARSEKTAVEFAKIMIENFKKTENYIKLINNK